jgi:diacylglycerol kinase family enzyme
LIEHLAKIKQNTWQVIVNPNAGRRKIEKDWNKIEVVLNKAGLSYSYIFTDHKEHAI